MDSANLHRRLAKIMGQFRAIDRMIDEDIPCEDILSQISAAKSALNKTGQVALEGHINHCIRDAVARGDDKEIENFTTAIERFANIQSSGFGSRGGLRTVFFFCRRSPWGLGRLRGRCGVISRGKCPEGALSRSFFRKFNMPER